MKRFDNSRQQLLTRREASARAGIVTVTLDNWRRRGLLKTYWEEGRVYINLTELEKLLGREALSWRKRPGRKTMKVND